MTPLDLRAIRLGQDMTQAEFANFLGVSPRHMRRLEADPACKSWRPVSARIELFLIGAIWDRATIHETIHETLQRP